MTPASVEFSPSSLASMQLAREMWTSFASLLRSHVAMRALAQPTSGLKIVSLSETNLEITSPSQRIRIVAPNQPNHGTVESTVDGLDMQEQRQAFVFTEDGSICFDKVNRNPQTMEMEAAVEFLLDEVGQ